MILLLEVESAIFVRQIFFSQAWRDEDSFFSGVV